MRTFPGSPTQGQFDKFPDSVEKPQAVNILTKQSTVEIESMLSVWSASSSNFKVKFEIEKDTDEPVYRRASAFDIPIYDQLVNYRHPDDLAGGFVKPRSNSVPWTWPRAVDRHIPADGSSAGYQDKGNGVWGPLESTPWAPLPEQRSEPHDNENKHNPQYVPFPNNIACILDNAGAPNLLFSSYSLGGHFKELLPKERLLQGTGTNFVILDNYMDKAIEILNNLDSNLVAIRTASTSILHAHNVHFDRDPTDNHGPIALYLKSRMLWWIEDWTVDRPSHRDPHLSLSNWDNCSVWQKDPCVASSNYSDSYPAKILEIAVLIQASMHLYCRDYNEVDGRQNWWKPMLLALMKVAGEQIHPDGWTDIISVGPVCQPYWSDFIDPETEDAQDAPYWKALLGLREYLIDVDYLVEPQNLCITGP
ncbi:hypothetical protein N7526_003378 [Penicillium atrosanguineum]|nr:hypothetical protein N7526_003378 [Penicillium atrosanguineum]